MEDIGNGAGYVYKYGRLVMLLPQLYQSHVTQSVWGVSFLWVFSNATIEICDFLTTFSGGEAILNILMAMYMPALQMLLLVLFVMHHEHGYKKKLRCMGIVALIWVTIVVVGLCAGDGMVILGWITTLLGCLESVPQLFLNVEERHTVGQSKWSVGLRSIVGCANSVQSVLLSGQSARTLIVSYYSSTHQWINALHIIGFEGHHQDGRIAGKVCAVLLSVLLATLFSGVAWRMGAVAVSLPVSVGVVLLFHHKWLRHRPGYVSINS